MVSYCESNELPYIQGYYIHIDTAKEDHQRTQEIRSHETIISKLKTKANLEIIVLQMSYPIGTASYKAMKSRLPQQGWLLHEKQLRACEDFSDRVSSHFDLIIGLSANYFRSKEHTAFDNLSPTPAVPNGISPNILVEFNHAQYALPYVGDLFTVESVSLVSTRQPTVQYLIKQKEEDLLGRESGYQVYHKDSPAPLPSSTNCGPFGNLFGISFANDRYTAVNNETKEHVRAVAVAEYTSFFGYDANYSTYLNGQPDVLPLLGRTLPYNTATRIAETTSLLLESSINIRSEEASLLSGVDLSVPAFYSMA